MPKTALLAIFPHTQRVPPPKLAVFRSQIADTNPLQALTIV